MLRFFRKTRKKLLENNKVTKYLLYATGEIILIVIGILIALAINNWSINDQNRQQEQFYLKALKTEFITSQLKLEKLIEVNKLNYENAKEIAVFITSEEAPSEQELSKLIYEALAYNISYNPNNSVLNELINTGGLKVITSESLRLRLTSWESFIESVHKQEETLNEQRERVLEVFRREGSIRTGLDEAGVTKEIGLSPSPQPSSNLELLSSTPFENELLLLILNGVITEKEHFLPLREEIQKILTLIDQEIED